VLLLEIIHLGNVFPFNVMGLQTLSEVAECIVLPLCTFARMW